MECHGERHTPLLRSALWLRPEHCEDLTRCINMDCLAREGYGHSRNQQSGHHLLRSLTIGVLTQTIGGPSLRVQMLAIKHNPNHRNMTVLSSHLERRKASVVPGVDVNSMLNQPTGHVRQPTLPFIILMVCRGLCIEM